MRAIGTWSDGGPAALELVELPLPVPGASQIRVRVAAATVNPADLSMVRGELSGQLPEQARPFVAGLEASGVVDAVGAGSSWRVGQRVAVTTHFIGTGRGTHAEFVVVDDASVASLPEVLDLVPAATIPMSGLTARLAVDVVDLAPGATIAVTGAGGAVGAFVIQLALRDGLRVVGVARREYERRVRGWGADFVPADAPAHQVHARWPDGVDAVVDTALMGAATLPMIRDGGRLVMVRPLPVEPERGIASEVISFRKYIRRTDKLTSLIDLAARGGLELPVEQAVPLEDARAAYERVDAGGLTGRIVLTF